MKSGRIPYPPEPRDEETERCYDIATQQILTLLKEEMGKVDSDTFLYGKGGVHFSEQGEITRLDLLSLDEKIRKANEPDDSFTRVEMLTKREIMVRYPHNPFIF